MKRARCLLSASVLLFGLSEVALGGSCQNANYQSYNTCRAGSCTGHFISYYCSSYFDNDAWTCVGAEVTCCGGTFDIIGRAPFNVFPLRPVAERLSRQLKASRRFAFKRVAFPSCSGGYVFVAL